MGITFTKNNFKRGTGTGDDKNGYSYNDAKNPTKWTKQYFSNYGKL